MHGCLARLAVNAMKYTTKKSRRPCVSSFLLGVPAFTGEKELFLGLSSSYAKYLKKL